MHIARQGVAAGLAALIGVASSSAAAQQADGQDAQQPSFRSDVQMVLHSVAVLGPDGEPVRGLQRGDFAVYEAEEKQDITVFLSPDESPLDVATVIDSSASLSQYARLVRIAARSFFVALEPLDCVYLLPFNDEVGPGAWDRGLLMPRRVDGIFMQGGTALYDALVHGMGVLNRTIESSPNTGCGNPIELADSGRPARRRAVVLMTDGADEHSQARYDEVLDVADVTAIPIFPVLHGEAQRNDRLRALLERMAGETGGATVDAQTPDRLEDAFADVVVMLRASYLIGYLPPEGDEREQERSVRIRSRPGFRLVYRSTYWR
ncbi:MAG: VWA domain-containing protein [Acidobacteria bacterium]|nr:VWA domain-containing protein [Acidobacteriota bacterium]